MASFSTLGNNVEDAFKQNKTMVDQTCVCCLSENVVMINLKTCKHTSFYRSISAYMLQNEDGQVCVVCHNMLKKIDAFQKQVEEATALLIDKAKSLIVNKLHKLQYSPMHYTDSTTPYVKIEPIAFKAEETEVEIDTVFQTDVKVEHDDSDFEPLPAVKKKKKRDPVDKYEGKIRVITLTVEELNAERDALSNEMKYVSLPYKCEHCIMGFDHEITWKTHMEQRHTVKKSSFQCNICKSVLTSKSSYTEHMKRHLRRLECVDCGKRYNRIQSAIQHYDEKHLPAGSSLQRGYTCQECGFTTTVNRKYRYHLDKHKQKQECTICGNIFVNTNSLKCHMYTVHKQSSRVYRCDSCDKTYRAKSGLMAHTRSVHGTAPRAYCAPCRTHYTTHNALQAHLNTHSRHSDKRFICDECGAKFVKKSTLQMHINWKHLKINTHSCHHCTKIFKSASCLRRHVTFVHDKQRPPRDKICHFCGRGFTTQTILQSHLRTHTGERPLQCQHCRATFAHSGALYTHMKLKHVGLSK